MKSPSASNTDRAGFSFLELQVALILLGIAFAGLVPLVVMQERQLKRLEGHYGHRTTNDVNRAGYVPTTYYLVPAVVGDRPPSAGHWARKVGTPAVTLQSSIPVSSTEPTPTNEVKIMWVDTSLGTWRGTRSVQARVWVKAIPEEEEEEGP
jgi:hypothetical protein